MGSGDDPDDPEISIPVEEAPAEESNPVTAIVDCAALPPVLHYGTVDQMDVMDLPKQIRQAILGVSGLVEELRPVIDSASDSEIVAFVKKAVTPTAREVFELLDLDGDGVITMREVGKALRGKRKGRRTSSGLSHVL